MHGRREGDLRWSLLAQPKHGHKLKRHNYNQANTCIVGGNEGSEESDESDDTGSGSDESIGDSNSGHGVEELVSCSGGARSVKPSVKGRLRQCLPFWKEEIGAPHTILEIIEHGYVLPLMSEPTARLGKNCLSAFRHAQFVDESVKELLEAGCIARLPEVPHVSSPLSVVENSSGKKRLVVNLRHLNRFLWKQKFKYEDLRVAMPLLEKDDFLFSFDLKSGYHHVDICREHWKYLGVSWGVSIMYLQSCLLAFLLHAIFLPKWSVPWSGTGEKEG